MTKSREKQKGSGAPSTPAKPRRVDTSQIELKRRAAAAQEERSPPPSNSDGVSAGPIDRVIELAFNPSREKIREVTIIDRMQGRLFPILDTTDALFLDCIKVAAYRQSPKNYAKVFNEEQPTPMVDILGELLYRTAQWQKSVAGKNLERATDIALAETETREPEEEPLGAGRGYED
jgi:hypothetical protein